MPKYGKEKRDFLSLKLTMFYKQETDCLCIAKYRIGFNFFVYSSAVRDTQFEKIERSNGLISSSYEFLKFNFGSHLHLKKKSAQNLLSKSKFYRRDP